MLLSFGSSTNSFIIKKPNKTKLMLCKALISVYGNAKGLLKVILQYKNEMP